MSGISHSFESRTKISNTKQGKKQSEEHKRKRAMSRSNKTIFSFKNLQTGETFIGTPYMFRVRFSLVPNGVSLLTLGKLKTHANWTIDK